MTFHKFCGKYDGKSIADAGAYTSTEFDRFTRDFKSACSAAFPETEYEIKVKKLLES